jgi:hypothetical protein
MDRGGRRIHSVPQEAESSVLQREDEGGECCRFKPPVHSACVREQAPERLWHKE